MDMTKLKEDITQNDIHHIKKKMDLTPKLMSRRFTETCEVRAKANSSLPTRKSLRRIPSHENFRPRLAVNKFYGLTPKADGREAQFDDGSEHNINSSTNSN